MIFWIECVYRGWCAVVCWPKLLTKIIKHCLVPMLQYFLLEGSDKLSEIWIIILKIIKSINFSLIYFIL